MLAQFKSTTTGRSRKNRALAMGAVRPVKAWHVGEEPRLGDLLDDDAMQRLMARDGVDREALLALVHTMRERLAVAGG